MLRFVKYHGLGNDFILVDGMSATITMGSPASGSSLRPAFRRRRGWRDPGLALGQRRLPDAAFQFRWLRDRNVRQWLRCLARFVWDEGLIPRTEMTVKRWPRIKRARLHVKDGQFARSASRWVSPCCSRAMCRRRLTRRMRRRLTLPLDVEGVTWQVTALNTGVPHCVVFVTMWTRWDWRTLGPRIEHHMAFPAKTNVMFTQVVARDRLHIHPWERGAGATLACGTGACAAAVAGRSRGERSVMFK